MCKELYGAQRRSDAIALLVGCTGTRNVGGGPNGNSNFEWSAYVGFARAFALATEAQELYRDSKIDLAELQREANLAQEITSEMGEKLVEFESERAKGRQKADQEIHVGRQRFERARKLAIVRLWRWRNTARSIAEQQNGEFKSLQDAFNAHLRLKRPVELWSERRKEHAIAAQKAWTTFVVVAILFSFVGVATVILLGEDIARTFVKEGCRFGFEPSCKGISPRGPLTISAILLVSTIVLWFLRFQMRIYLSERHLSLDARERMAFAETYLSLLKGADVTNEHEVVILQSLFRPTQDGIIKDDLGPDIGIASLAARTLDSKRV